MRTRIYLVRHCEVENPRGLLYGHLDNFPLSTRGVAQAEALGRRLAGSGVARIAASPLERAQETAAIIARHIPGSEVVTTNDLVEAEFGRYLQGIPLKQIPWRRPLWWVHMLLPGVLPNDETVTAMAARVERSLRQILADFPGRGGICVSHGDPIQAFWLRHKRRPVWALHRLQCAKGGMLVLDYAGQRLDKVGYLPPAGAGSPGTAPRADPSHA